MDVAQVWACIIGVISLLWHAINVWGRAKAAKLILDEIPVTMKLDSGELAAAVEQAMSNGHSQN